MLSPLMAILASLTLVGVQGANVEVVVSHFNENLGWLSQLTSDKAAAAPHVSIYTKGATPIEEIPRTTIYSLPNVGRESHTYLSHIVKNYERLADWTVFTQGGAPSFGYNGHREGGGHLMAGDSFANYLTPDPSGSRFIRTAVVHLPSMNHLLRAAFCINDTRVEGGSNAACPKKTSQWTSWWDIGPFHDFIATKTEMEGGEPVMDFYRKYINPSFVGKELTISFPQGARFAVSREKILRRPKADYELLLQTLSKSTDPYSGYFMEWMWSELFLGRQEPCTIPPRATAISHAMALDELARRYPEEVKRYHAKMAADTVARRMPSVSTGVSGGCVSGCVSGGGNTNTPSARISAAARLTLARAPLALLVGLAMSMLA